MNTQKHVETFMRAAGQTVLDRADGAAVKGDQARLYRKLVEEEFKEFVEATDAGIDLKHIAKEAADLIWVIEGYCHSVGIPLERVFTELGESNGSKIVDGKVIRREDGKILKPSTYFEPDLNRAFLEDVPPKKTEYKWWTVRIEQSTHTFFFIEVDGWYEQYESINHFYRAKDGEKVAMIRHTREDFETIIRKYGSVTSGIFVE